LCYGLLEKLEKPALKAGILLEEARSATGYSFISVHLELYRTELC
jgi:hypothetical protein